MMQQLTDAIRAMRSGSDRDVITAVTILSAQPIEEVMEQLLDHLATVAGPRRPTDPSERTPSDQDFDAAMSAIQLGDSRALARIAGDAFEGLLVLLVGMAARHG